MKPLQTAPTTNRHRAGLTLWECLVYIGALGLVFGLGLNALHRCIEHTAAVRRNSDDITLALKAGEQWRTDLRRATQPPTLDPTTQTLIVWHSTNQVAYRLTEHQMQRRANPSAPWQTVMPRVQQSEMRAESRPHTTAWRWELELQPRHAAATIRPLFTFTAAVKAP